MIVYLCENLLRVQNATFLFLYLDHWHLELAVTFRKLFSTITMESTLSVHSFIGNITSVFLILSKSYLHIFMAKGTNLDTG